MTFLNRTATFAFVCFRYSTVLIPVRGLEVHWLVGIETLLELRSELRLDALPDTTIEFSGIQIHKSLRANTVLDVPRHSGNVLQVHPPGRHSSQSSSAEL